jgi:iron complex transport system ATP-binding protein
MTELVATQLSIKAENTLLLEDASVSLASGEVVAILGSNGAGKTSLLRAILGLLDVASGSVTLDGREFHSLSPVQRAQHIAYLPQRRPLAWPNKVRDVVALGLFAHGVSLGRLSPKESATVHEAIKSCDLEGFEDRNVLSLSGGELARVHFARVLATHAPLLLADEPVAELDPRFQLQIAKLIRQFVDAGGGALVVLHEVALAADLADRLIWMNDGRIVATGTPQETLTPQTLADVYGVKAHVAKDEHGFDVRIRGFI